jgi:phosphatidylserine decarboxylase
LFFFIKWFARDPERVIPSGEGLILSAADGRVCAIERVRENLYLDGEGIRIGIYLSLFDVHVNRVPITGVVGFLSYSPGLFLPAHHDQATLRNEHQLAGFENDRGKILVKQIAGFFARRIICHLHQGAAVTAGERFGKITFGSKVELTVPPNIELRVSIGERVKAGETIIGVME